MLVPIATYRLQFNPSFGFQEAKKVLPYLYELGISDIYASPIFKATKGSTHGYDIVDPNKLNPELGNRDDFNEMMSEKQQYNMGWLQDIVPNHMSFNSENKMLMDIFENGKQSRFFTFFDITWDHPDKDLRDKVLVPVLGRLFKKALASSEIRLRFNAHGFSVQYYEFCLPVCLSCYSEIIRYAFKKSKDINPPLKSTLKNLLKLCDRFELLAKKPYSDERDGQVRKAKKTLWDLYSSHKGIRKYIKQILDLYNGKNSFTNKFAPLESLLSKQYFRLAIWKKASDRINYRRFFYLNDFIGLRVEKKEVFEFTHQLLLRLAQGGNFTGLRIDHVDGLYNPTKYLKLLREKLNDTYLVVEKILETHESLLDCWPVQGTTGYEFANYVNQLFCCKENEKDFSKTYNQFIGLVKDYNQLVFEKKKHIVQKYMAGDVRYLVYLFENLVGEEIKKTIVTSQVIEEVLIELIAAFPVYRTYINSHKYTQSDKDYVKKAIALASIQSPHIKQTIDFIGRCLLCENKILSEKLNKKCLNFIMKFQQLTGPAMAKGFEDTVLYGYNRLISLNEVGSQPDCFGISIEEFHEFNSERAKLWRLSLNTTSTHDTKRGEDVRARINILSEIPKQWNSKVTYWRQLNKQKKAVYTDGLAPDANDEYFLYQTLIGSMPFNEVEYKTFKKRVKEYLLKAIREAKVHTSWIEPNKEYENACEQFVDELLVFSHKDEFWRDFISFQKNVSAYAVYNSLSQIIIKMTAPGIPDFYQGSELWDLSMVDPDNRRTVHFKKRADLLASIKKRERQNNPAFFTELLKYPENGCVKMFLIYKLLTFRRRYRRIFEDGDYQPLSVTGKQKNHVVAFTRRFKKRMAVVVAIRFVTYLINPAQLPMGKEIWKDTNIKLPEHSSNFWLNVITGEKIQKSNKITIGDILKKFPVAMLVPGQT